MDKTQMTTKPTSSNERPEALSEYELKCLETDFGIPVIDKKSATEIRYLRKREEELLGVIAEIRAKALPHWVPIDDSASADEICLTTIIRICDGVK